MLDYFNIRYDYIKGMKIDNQKRFRRIFITEKLEIASIETTHSIALFLRHTLSLFLLHPTLLSRINISSNLLFFTLEIS